MGSPIESGRDFSYAHAAAVVVGEVVKVGNCLMQAMDNYAANELGAYHADGVIVVPASQVASVAFVPGLRVSWDNSAGAVTAAAPSATGDVWMGHVWESANVNNASGGNTLKVRLQQPLVDAS